MPRSRRSAFTRQSVACWAWAVEMSFGFWLALAQSAARALLGAARAAAAIAAAGGGGVRGGGGGGGGVVEGHGGFFAPRARDLIGVDAPNTSGQHGTVGA